MAAVGGEDEIGLVEEGALTPGRESAEVVGLRDDGAEAARAASTRLAAGRGRARLGAGR